ncbi:YqjF family protein [Kineococcus terrestris]|uniref:YqjF family protein n=1 Tax=Kineococcus terrestris TaxID=2044856 RepID=UPI0034DB6A7F
MLETPGPAPVPRLPPRAADPLRGPVMMHQHWDELAFLHWAVDPALAAPFVPPGTEPDVLDGVTYVGLIPFTLRGAGLGRLPAVPWLGTFLETNVRLYSRDAAGRRGVVFRSLDADRLAVVLGARTAFGLPYRFARMHRARRGDEVGWATTRPVRSRVVVRARPELVDDDGPDDVATFVTARYGLHTVRAGRTWWIANEHEEWPLRRADVLDLDDELLAAAGFPGLASRPPDHVAFSDRVTTRFALPRPLPRARDAG